MSARIYTRSGDTGETGLFGGERVHKDDLRVESCGAVDELNAALGLACALRAEAELDALLADLQSELLGVGADLATPTSADEIHGRIHIRRVDAGQVDRLETLIDRYEEELPPLTSFILPGGHALAAALHWARVVCRRAERRCVSLARAELSGERQINPELLRYMNRLSDLLFVLARVANRRQGVEDVVWRNRSSQA